MAVPAVRVAKTYSGNSPATEAFTSGAAVTAGTWVRINADFKVDPAAAADEEILGMAATTVAAADLEVIVVLAHPDVVFSCDSAGTATYVDQGEFCDLGASSKLNLAAQDDGLFKIVGPDTTEASGRYLVTVNYNESQMGAQFAQDT